MKSAEPFTRCSLPGRRLEQSEIDQKENCRPRAISVRPIRKAKQNTDAPVETGEDEAVDADGPEAFPQTDENYVLRSRMAEETHERSTREHGLNV